MMTNADKIIASGLDAMSVILAQRCPPNQMCGTNTVEHSACPGCWLRWLREEEE